MKGTMISFDFRSLVQLTQQRFQVMSILIQQGHYQTCQGRFPLMFMQLTCNIASMKANQTNSRNLWMFS